MAEFAQPMRFPVDMDKGLTPRSQRSILRQGDAFANRVIAVLTQDDKQFDASSMTVVGTFIRPRDEARIDLEGEAKGNEVSVLLDEKCYEVPGAYTLDIMLVLGEKRRTILTICGEVERKGNGELVISGVVENLDEKIEELRALKAELEDVGADLEDVGADLEDAAAAQMAAIQKKGEETLETIPEKYADLDADVKSLKDQKANVIMDESPKAASHELHAQDGPLAVTLYGKTTETGTGDKSPDNPYVIGGVDAANIYTSGMNMFDANSATDGHVLAGSGALTENAGYFVSDYIPIGGDFTVQFSSNTDSMRIGFYDANKALIDRPYYEKSPVTLNRPDARYVRLSSKTEDKPYVQIELGDVATEYKPYSTVNLPLLPSGSPLMGNGTVDDTVENDVLSGCDKTFVIDGTLEVLSAGFNIKNGKPAFYARMPYNMGAPLPSVAFSSHMQRIGFLNTDTSTTIPVFAQHSDDKHIGIYVPGIETVADMKTYLSANPLTVFYRSTEYTPDKDLRVCEVTRKWNTVTLDGSNDETYTVGATAVDGVKRFLVGSIADCAPVNSNYDVGNIVSNLLPTAAIQYGSYAGVQSIGVDVSKRVYICIDGVADEATLRALLAEKPIKVAYQTAAGKVYMTDPLPLRKPEGIMPVTVTGSGETAVTYPRDTKDWGKNAATTMIGMAESGMTATQNYASGAFIVNKDTLTLYRATKAIAKGEAITPGTNCAATTVVEQLANLYTLLNA